MPALVVEFIGLPGSGKSALAHAVGRVLRERGVVVHEPTYTLAHEKGETTRQAVKARQALTTLVRSPSESLSWFRTFAGSRQARRSDLIKLTINWLHLTAVVEQAKRSSGIVLLDQGLLQALWSIEYEAGTSVLDGSGLAERLASCLPERAALVLTEVSLATTARRLTQRPGAASRVEQASDGEAQRALARAREVLNRVEELAAAVATYRAIPLMRVANDEDGGLAAAAQRLAPQIATLAGNPPEESPSTAASKQQSG